MRAAACDPMPKVLCGWPRSHLLSSMLAVQRLAGWSRDPSSMGLRRSSIHGSVHLARPRRRWRWMLSKQSSVTLERSCSTGRGCRITRGWRAEARGSRLAARSAVLAKVRLNKQPARVGLARRARLDGRSYVHSEGSGATLQDRGRVTGTRGSHKGAALASYSPNCTF